MQGSVNVVPDPESPELPELPELPEVVVPSAEASPVAPDSALPEPPSVSFVDVEPALPLWPPVVEPSEVDAPELPEEAVMVAPSDDDPVSPEVAVPLVLLAAGSQPEPSTTP